MVTVVFIDSQANGAGGGDVTPTSISGSFNDVVVTSGSGIETTNEVTIAGITSPIVVRFAWTSTSGSPTKARIMKNGAAVQTYELTYVEVTCINGDKLKWETYAAYTHPAGNYDTGTVTVTNQSDGGATLDTFPFACQYVRTGGGSGGGGGYNEPPNIN
jgi:hypothetical protein